MKKSTRYISKDQFDEKVSKLFLRVITEEEIQSFALTNIGCELTPSQLKDVKAALWGECEHTYYQLMTAFDAAIDYAID